MMNCQKKLRYLGEIVDGTAPLMRRFMFHMHIMMCGRCRLYYKQFKQVNAAAGEVTPEDLPGDFFEVMDDLLPHFPEGVSKASPQLE